MQRSVVYYQKMRFIEMEIFLINESNGVQGVQTRLKRKDRFESK